MIRELKAKIENVLKAQMEYCTVTYKDSNGKLQYDGTTVVTGRMGEEILGVSGTNARTKTKRCSTISYTSRFSKSGIHGYKKCS